MLSGIKLKAGLSPVHPVLSRGLPVLCLAILVLLSGCGRKELPQLTGEGPPPVISEITHIVEGNILVLNLRLQGGANGIGYQVDRAEVDPYCKCPGFWRRFFERPPMLGQAGKQLDRNIDLNTSVGEYVFRVRATDGLGRLGPWSRIFRAKAKPMIQ